MGYERTWYVWFAKRSFMSRSRHCHDLLFLCNTSVNALDRGGSFPDCRWCGQPTMDKLQNHCCWMPLKVGYLYYYRMTSSTWYTYEIICEQKYE
jgi:hypothetical protein